MAVDRTAQHGNIQQFRDSLIALVLICALFGALAGAWLVRSAPLDPTWARGLVRLDGLAACFSVLTIALALAMPRRTDAQPAARSPQPFLAALLLCAALLTTHVALLSAALVGLALLSGVRNRLGWAAALLAGGGFVLIALRAGTWRYPTPDAGLGLNSVSFGLILCAALLAVGAPALVSGRAPRPLPLLAVGLVYALYRLFSFGPWNLGWQLAALLLGAAVALGSAWQIALRTDGAIIDRLITLHGGLAIIGGGLASGAGLALGVYALLALALQCAALQRASGSRLLWLASGAVPFTVPFVAGWIGIAAALAGGITALAMAIWAALLLAAAGIARLAVDVDEGPTPNDEESSSSARGSWSLVFCPSSLRLRLASLLSLALGIATPAVFAVLIQPMAAQLQGGLTPFGDITLWPWAGLLALNAARQPVATLPSLALAALMLILAALAWLITHYAALRRADAPEEP